MMGLAFGAIPSGGCVAGVETHGYRIAPFGLNMTGLALLIIWARCWRCLHPRFIKPIGLKWENIYLTLGFKYSYIKLFKIHSPRRAVMPCALVSYLLC